MRGAAIEPGPAPVAGALVRSGFSKAEGIQAFEPGGGTLPLAPDHAAQAPPDPTIQFLGEAFGLAEAEVVHPAPKQRVQRLADKPLDVASSALAEAQFQLRAHLHACLVRYTDLWLFVRGEAVSEEDPRHRSGDSAFFPGSPSVSYPLRGTG